MFRANFVLATGAVILLSGCSGFSLSNRTDEVSARDTADSRATRSTKYPNNPRSVLAPPARSNDANPRKGTRLAAKSSTSAQPMATTRATEDTRIHELIEPRGLDEARSNAEEVAALSTSTGARQTVIDPAQLNLAPVAKHTEPEMPDRSRRYTPAPNPSMDNFGDIADQRMPLPDRPRLYTFGPTKPGDTLADIAYQLVPSEGVTIAQMMWALYRKNPGAFSNKNINNLKPRSLLRVPELDELMAISRLEADTQIARLHGAVKPKVSATY